MCLKNSKNCVKKFRVKKFSVPLLIHRFLKNLKKSKKNIFTFKRPFKVIFYMCSKQVLQFGMRLTYFNIQLKYFRISKNFLKLYF